MSLLWFAAEITFRLASPSPSPPLPLPLLSVIPVKLGIVGVVNRSQEDIDQDKVCVRVCDMEGGEMMAASRNMKSNNHMIQHLSSAH